jgi:hypothetical protein
VTKAWIDCGDLEKATLVLEDIQLHRDSKRLPEGPDLHTYQALLAAWNHSIHPEKELNVLKISAEIADLLGGHHDT